MRVLITGGGGQLATDLVEELDDQAEALPLAQAELDITDAVAVARIFTEYEPDVVFNCAAFHNIDVCEREAARAWEVNATAVKGLAESCARADAVLVHVSTNYVFDGTAVAPYTEASLPRPLSVYAASKLAGEHLAMAYNPRSIVARTTGLYGRAGNASKGGNFVERVLARAREDGSLQMVSDQWVNPTYSADLASALIEAVRAQAYGLLHLVNVGDCTWFDFTLEILRGAGVEIPVTAVASAHANGDPQRPLNGLLACSAAAAAGLTPLRPWPGALAEYMLLAGLTG